MTGSDLLGAGGAVAESLAAVVAGVVRVAEQGCHQERLAAVGLGNLFGGEGEIDVGQVAVGLAADAEQRSLAMGEQVGEFRGDGLAEGGLGEIAIGVMPAVVVMGIEGDAGGGSRGTNGPHADLAGVGFEQAGQFVAESRTGLIGVLGRDGRLHEAPRRAGNRMTPRRAESRDGPAPRALGRLGVTLRRGVWRENREMARGGVRIARQTKHRGAKGGCGGAVESRLAGGAFGECPMGAEQGEVKASA